MRTADGENFNKGMDGVYPIVAGAVDGERKKKLLEHIKNPNEMWSAAGISAVDMALPITLMTVIGTATFG